MNDKWEARSDRLHMREYCSGQGSLTPTGDTGYHTMPGRNSMAVTKLWATGLRRGRPKAFADTCSTLLSLPTFLLTHWCPVWFPC